MIAALSLGIALATEPSAPTAGSAPWERHVIGVELLIAQPTIGRVLHLQRRPPVEMPAPIEGSFGHVALRLVDEGPAEAQWTVGISAHMDLDGDGADDPSNVWLGLTGGYDQRVLMAPLEEFTRVYADEESRWIRRYAIPMTPGQIGELLDSIREASGLGERRELGRYSFFTENCSTEITQILDRALFGEPRELNVPYTLPRKFERRGVITPELGTVTPAAAHTGAFDANWAVPSAILQRCADGDLGCAERWVEGAKAAFGDDWVDEMARRTRRRAYARLTSAELVAELERTRADRRGRDVASGRPVSASVDGRDGTW